MSRSRSGLPAFVKCVVIHAILALEDLDVLGAAAEGVNIGIIGRFLMIPASTKQPVVITASHP